MVSHTSIFHLQIFGEKLDRKTTNKNKKPYILWAESKL